MTNLVFIHRGNDDYLKYTLKQAAYFNKNSNITCLSDTLYENVYPKEVKFQSLNQYFGAALEFEKIYEHLSRNSYQFELFCFQRWFILKEYMEKNNINEVFYIDSDVMLFGSLDSIDLHDADYGTCIRSPHFSFWTLDTLKEFCDFIKDLYNNTSKLKEDFYKNMGIVSISDVYAITEFSLVSRKKLLDFSKFEDNIIEHNINGSKQFEKVYSVSSSSEYKKKIYLINKKLYLKNLNKDKFCEIYALHFQGQSKTFIKFFMQENINIYEKNMYFDYNNKQWISDKLLSDIFELIKLKQMDRLKEKPSILFGASNAGREALNFMMEFGLEVKYFCDNDLNKVGKEFWGIKVISPDCLKDMCKEYNILITSQYRDEISSQLAKLQLKNVFYDIEINRFSGFYLSNIIYENIRSIVELCNILNDEFSKKTVLNIIKYRLNGNLNIINSIISSDQYFDSEIVNLYSDEVFIDVGAYIGDTVGYFIKECKGDFKKIFCFEPDKSNFEILVNNANVVKYKNKIITENAGVSDKDGIAKFNAEKEYSSYISNNGVEEIKIYSLDAYLKNIKPTFIKVDVEGAEYEVIKGSEELIKKYKPKLAICIYHKPRDLWELPLYLKSLVPEYNIYIRHYSSNVWDTVCYAIP